VDGTVKGQLSRTRKTKATYEEGPRSKARSAMTNSSMPVLTRE
jgi:hypothetical protein